MKVSTLSLVVGSVVALAVLSVPALRLGSIARAAGDGSSYAEKQSKDIVQTAVDAGSFKTLAAALEAAGLVQTLKSAGPFTVFAPTDEAFAKLPAGTVESLLEPENKDKLVAVLTYHVVPSKAMAKDVAGMSAVKTVNGKKLRLNAADGKVMVDNATVVQADIEASNGVIHVIDTVLIP